MIKELAVTSIERELRFTEWCKKNGILRFLLDLDDTICATREVFRWQMGVAVNFLNANCQTVSREEWHKQIEMTNNKLFEQYGVNSSRWNKVVDELAELHELSPYVKQRTKRIFSRIYLKRPQILVGADEGLAFLSKAKVPIGIVTHAGPKWTWKKFNWLKLDRFVDWDDVFIVDQDTHKTAESWDSAVKYFGLKPEECAVVGDSPRSDINPAFSIGVKRCFLVEDSKQWTIHNQPVDATVKKITNISQIVDAVLE